LNFKQQTIYHFFLLMSSYRYPLQVSGHESKATVYDVQIGFPIDRFNPEVLDNPVRARRE
jgi:hypothetical protein